MYEECFESGECETVTKPNSAEEPEEVRQGLAKRWNL